MEGAVNMRQNRRGLSAVVGAIFMVLIMLGALNAFIWVTQEQGRIFDALTGESDTNLNKLNERIEITNVRVDGNRLNVTVTNTGGQVANIKSLYIVNETNSQQYRYPLEKVVDNRKSEVNIGQDSAITTIKSDAKYSVKVVTASGNSASAVVAPASAAKWPMSLYAIPPNPPPNSNVTLLFAVTNNSTDTFLASGVTPILSPTPNAGTSCTPACAALDPKVTPSSNVPIAKGATTLFKWIYYIGADDNTKVTFTATLQGAQAGNSVTETVKVDAPIADQTSLLTPSSLAQKPDTYLTVPSPAGEAGLNDDQVAWGITVVNPTPLDMTVSRVLLTGLTSEGATQKLFVPSNCAITPVYPTTASEWSCIGTSQLEWKDVANPESVPQYGAKSFRAFVEPGSIGTSEYGYTLVATVFTNIGQFTSSGFSTTMDTSPAPLLNVYLTDANNTVEVLLTSKMMGNATVTQGSTNNVFKIAVVEHEDGSASRYIKSGGKLIINVPEDFDDVVVTSSTGFTVLTGYPKPFTNGAWQIQATIDDRLGDLAVAEGLIFEFTATAPTLTSPRIYVMHVMFSGLTESDFPATPFAQIPIEVKVS